MREYSERESATICSHKLEIYLCDKVHYRTGSYLFKVNKGNTRGMREMFKAQSKDTRTRSSHQRWSM